MSVSERLKHEIRTMALAALYFAAWLGALLGFKKLALAEYAIEFNGMSKALVGALILSKVVLVLEHVPLGAWIRTKPALADVAARTVLYSLGVLVVLLVEKGFDGRHEHDGFGPSLRAVFREANVHHVWLNSLALFGALLGYNSLAVVRRHLGPGGLLRLFLSPPASARIPSRPAE